MGGDLYHPVLFQHPLCFNPRPRMGGDATVFTVLIPVASFNPRPRMGGDLQYYSNQAMHCVSIHAPAWGAT